MEVEGVNALAAFRRRGEYGHSDRVGPRIEILVKSPNPSPGPKEDRY